ncbi:protein ANTAGONIST OF LIKE HETEROCHROMATIN PROTEIN 1-like [Amphibalanus amphitrite]|uniref:protein ANTAGONIST OF LIKE HETEROCHROMATIN PROTEIN 1-like n=1 Tax=Amphibalanus amphitrite TaxID=1232801 RepID=UPI001C9183BB|nr:protein ANTAGONIST OF LIKE HETEROCHROMATIN PROTEIN 1-like [Amphibalanus amphitrite]
MEDFDIFMAQAMILLVLCRRHLVNCQKAVYHLVSRTRMKSCAATQQRLRKKRRLIINLLMDLQQVQRQLGNGGRRWMLPRLRKHWFEREVMQVWEDDRWRENFRMTKTSFLKLVDLVRYKMEPKPTAVREPIPLEKRVAMALYNLASNMEYRVTANQFGSHKTTVRKHLLGFCSAVVECMADYIQLPSAAEAIEIARRWEAKWSFPQAYGAIDGTHIPITAPSDGFRDYVNRKGWPSIQLQAVCDDRYLFRNINCGAPGSSHDAGILAASPLQDHSPRLPKEPRMIEGVPVPLCLLGDPAYPLQPWLMKPYALSLASAQSRGLTDEQQQLEAERESFNVYHSAGRMAIECAFGRLKGRWRKLQKRIEVDVDKVPLIVSTCCILHNFCETQSEVFHDAWLPSPDVARQYPQPDGRAHPALNERTARDARDAVRVHLARHCPLRQSTLRF